MILFARPDSKGNPTEMARRSELTPKQEDGKPDAAAPPTVWERVLAKGVVGRFLLAVLRRFHADDALMMAAALSYTSLLSLVPLLTIALAILAAFPTFEPIRHELQIGLISMLVPDVGQAVRQMIDGLINNAGNLTAFGILGLVFTAILLLVTIEDALNRIFRVDQPRAPLSRLLVYWTVVTLGPLLLAASLSITDWLSAFGRHGKEAVQSGLLALAGHSLFRFTTLVSLFSLLYCLVPNRPVRPRDAIAGALLAGLLIAVLRIAFRIYVEDVRPYQSLYGALAVVPILLLWMYLVWLAVLAGAEFTASLGERREKS